MFLVHSAFMDMKTSAPARFRSFSPPNPPPTIREIYSIGGSIMSSVVIAIAAFKLR